MSDTLDLPELVTPRLRLRLRLLCQADAPDLQHLTNDPTILDAVHILANPFGLAEAEALIDGNASERDALIGGRLASSGAQASVCGVHLVGEHAVEIGYWVGSAHRGSGLAYEAAEAVIGVLREHVPRRLIVAECRPENRTSWNLLLKLGFRATGERGRRPGRLSFVA